LFLLFVLQLFLFFFSPLIRFESKDLKSIYPFE